MSAERRLFVVTGSARETARVVEALRARGGHVPQPDRLPELASRVREAPARVELLESWLAVHFVGSDAVVLAGEAAADLADIWPCCASRLRARLSLLTPDDSLVSVSGHALPEAWSAELGRAGIRITTGPELARPSARGDGAPPRERPPGRPRRNTGALFVRAVLAVPPRWREHVIVAALDAVDVLPRPARRAVLRTGARFLRALRS